MKACMVGNLLTPGVRNRLWLVAAVAVWSSSAYAGDAAKIVGADKCGECHKSEVEAWRQTHHFNTFNEMHRTDAAKEIAAKLGIKRMKAGSLCLTCHYTTQISGEKTKAVSGVSCESCHGAAKDWINIHNDYGGKDVTAENEPAEHRTQRLAKSAEAGMIHPTDIYAVAENCYQCHTVPHEELVDVGGHTAGSDFELVAWSQGEVRHNYARGNTNKTPPQDRLRVLYVIGRALDLEYGLRGVAIAKGKKVYAKTMAKRTARAAKKLEAVLAAYEISEVIAMLDALPRRDNGKLKLRPNAETEMNAAADAVAAQARKFAKSYDGSKLSAIDALLPKADAYKGTAKP